MTEPICSIGIAMSGGGYRAACFQLGTLGYLDRVDLLKHLKMISTVSGGTFTGASYILSLVEGKSFDEYMPGYYEFLEKTDLSGAVLHQLGHGTFQNKGRHSLITSAAQVYADSFLQRPDGSAYQMKDILNADLDVEEVIFNATEFHSGLSFRFQRSRSKQACMGNYYFRLRKGIDEARVADIVASSSCFPGGFEPIAFPNDFVWPNGEIPVEVQDICPEPIALMDGGVYDNQGLQNLILSDGRNPTDLDLLLISDVDQNEKVLYEIPNEAKDRSFFSFGNLSLRAVSWCILLIGLTGLFSALIDGYAIYNEYILGNIQTHDVLAGVVSIAFTCTVVTALFVARYIFRRRILPMVPNVGRAAWKDLRAVKLETFLDMMSLRINTLVTLTSSIFMKRVRGLVYERVYKDENYNDSRVSNLIYELSGDKKFANLPKSIREPETNEKLHRVCHTAAKMGTTLWWDDDYQQPALVACGQITLCYNLLKFVYKRNDRSIPKNGPDKELWDQLSSDWAAFNNDPYFMLRETFPDKELNYPPPLK